MEIKDFGEKAQPVVFANFIQKSSKSDFSFCRAFLDENRSYSSVKRQKLQSMSSHILCDALRER